MGIETIAVMSLAAGGISAAGQVMAGQAAKRNADYQAQVALNNSNIAKQNANYESALGEEKATNNQVRERAAMATQRSQQGANNLDVNFGSNLDVQATASEINAKDTETIKNDASRQAWNYRNQASNLVAQSKLNVVEGKQEEEGSYLSAGTSLLGGATSAGKFNYLYGG